MRGKPKLLAAIDPRALPILKEVVGDWVEIVPAYTLGAALGILADDREIGLVLCGAHFDESRMFELIDALRMRYPSLSVLCARILEDELQHFSVNTIGRSATNLGAAFVDLPGMAQRYGQGAAQEFMRGALLSLVR